MANSEYTEKQLQIINGEIPIESVNGYFLRWFYQKSLVNKDEDLANKIKEQIDVLKHEKSRERSRNRKAKLKNDQEIEWRQPRSNEYTEHQKLIVKGEIPYEDVHTNELISIHLKAHNNGDYELSERVLDLIHTRRMDYKERQIQYEKIRNKAHKNPKKINEFMDMLNINSPLTPIDIAILIRCDELDEYSKIRLQRILQTAKNHNDENLIALVETMILYNEDPSAFYVVKSHEEAIDLLEELFQLPIRRPETWFC